MLVLCWRPGQRTPIHDHNGSHGGVKVCKGTLWETTFNYDPVEGLSYKAARDYSTGLVTGSDVPDIHQLGNPDVSRTGSHHAPRLRSSSGRASHLQTGQRENRHVRTRRDRSILSRPSPLNPIMPVE